MNNEHTPDPHYSLSPAERARLREDIDLAALERLLGRLSGEMRDVVFRAFLRRPDDSAMGSVTKSPSDALQSHASLGYDVSFSDPDIQEMLEAVYKPTRAAHEAALARAHEFQQSECPLLEAPFVLAIVGELPRPDAVGLVRRRTDASPPDLIALLEPFAVAEWFDVAWQLLLAERRAAGLRPDEDFSTLISGKEATRELPASWEMHVQGILERVRAAPSGVLGDLGFARSSELRLV